MEGERVFVVDNLLKTEKKLIGDERIREALLRGYSTSHNPNPQLYQNCKITFQEKSESVLESVLRNMTLFEYDEDSANEDSDEILGPFYISEQDSMYIGQFRGDVREGRGIQVFIDGGYYEGYFKDNQTAKVGRLVFADGDMYLGQLKDNSMNGKGVYYKKDGSKYTGTFVNDAPEGKGREEWGDGAQFEGNYLRGSKHGYGVFRFANKTTYKGNFKEDLFWGKGTLIRPNGTEYQGDWVGGILKSPATIVSPNGNVYKGEIKKMQQHGKGEYNDHGRVFIGDFKNGKPDGRVVIKNADGTEQIAFYENGNFKNWISKPNKSTQQKKLASDNLVSMENVNKKKKKKKKGMFCCG